MSLLDATLWLQDTRFFSYLRISEFAYPLVLTGHLTGMALFGGTILATDLKLLGIGLSKWKPSEVIRQLRPLKTIGLLLVVTCGFLLFGSKAEEYYYNVFFRIKLMLLSLVVMHAIVFHSFVYGDGKSLDSAPSPPVLAKMAAASSLVLWTCIVIAGRAIGYIQAPIGIHAQIFQP